ncbi:MAG: helix-turn-helix domain-containing protein [Solobacterium sp.]|jgi:ribosome-binding protein aMBF1 (putative translation factor)|nr:helix-turn-helix domain-containing protein [Solobacterium sp.]
MGFRKVEKRETEAELDRLAKADPKCAVIIAQAKADAELKHLLYCARTDAGLSQKELGEKIGLSQQAICKIEKSGTNITLHSIVEYLAGTGKTLHLDIK